MGHAFFPCSGDRFEHRPFAWQVIFLGFARLEGAEQIGNEEDDEDGSQTNSGSAACAPPTVAVVAAARAEHENQDNNEYDDHFESPSIPGHNPGLMLSIDVV